MTFRHFKSGCDMAVPVFKTSDEAEISQDEKYRLEFLAESVAAWEHYQATGLHLTGEEVDAWVDLLIEGKDAELPECHV